MDAQIRSVRVLRRAPLTGAVRRRQPSHARNIDVGGRPDMAMRRGAPQVAVASPLRHREAWIAMT
jgi:hypothetical protein